MRAKTIKAGENPALEIEINNRKLNIYRSSIVNRDKAVYIINNTADKMR
ncbi:MAG: hypothetical protein XD73_0781 [Anaerolinea thermophila]|uniref:Uncharacterized protein n=1 Tax=Anaerolinea thermophila TaxID=167964 RepID=A0A101FXT3_9CHLR|nr:MAG: hypothetical protein XD73_0781 [Anaerolinea thermophila]